MNEKLTSNRADFPRSVLYTKPESVEALNAAAELGADALLVNLEHVEVSRLPEARRILSEWLEQEDRQGSRAWVKFTVDEQMLDLAALTGPVDYIMVPDAEWESLQQLIAALDEHEARHGFERGSIRLNALIEDARGLLMLEEIANLPRVQKLGIGRVDLMKQLRMTVDPEGVEITRFLIDLVIASAAARIDPPLASLYQKPDDPEGLLETTERLKSLGFVGRTAAYPQHIPTLNEVFDDC